MKLIVGLGNIGEQYVNTRHNIGFITLDAILKEFNLEINKSGFNGDYCETTINDEKVIFIKPTTLMNLSGNCVGEIARFYKIDHKDIVVIHDDLDLLPGQFRIRTSGSSGGHNGIKSIISSLGNDSNFIRFKIGIGHPSDKNVISHVLSKFTPEENKLNQMPIKKCIEFVKYLFVVNISQAIAKINERK